jgi:chromosome segregation protein
VIAEASGRVAELREMLAALGERREAAERELSAIGAQIVEVTQRHERAAGQIEAASRDRDEALASIEVDRTRHQSLSGELAALDTQIRADLEALEVARRELNAREAEWDEARSAFDQWKDSHNTARIEQARIASELRHLVGLCQSELGDSIESVCLDTFETLSEDELEVHEEEHRSLRQRLDAIGNVNMMAVEEYEEAEQRFVFLSTQRQDLFDSIRDTTQAIAEIDSVSSRRFGEAFREINGRFRQAFLDLFGGGHGELRLLEEGESQDAGIEIVAQPPGKKLQNVLLLSGGEKALTALALVIALFRFRPSPFCVLDEVDAPLDDANVDRFANMIRIMSEETQFIVITHSKRTMETANQLYGVTMEEPGVSKVVSVRLN